MQLTERDWTVWVGGHRCRQFPRICLLVVLSFTFSHFSVVVSGQKGIFLAAVPTLGFQSSQQHLKTTAHHRCCDRKAAPPPPPRLCLGPKGEDGEIHAKLAPPTFFQRRCPRPWRSSAQLSCRSTPTPVSACGGNMVRGSSATSTEL